MNFYQKELDAWKQMQLSAYSEIDQAILILAAGCPRKRADYETLPITYLGDALLTR